MCSPAHFDCQMSMPRYDTAMLTNLSPVSTDDIEVGVFADRVVPPLTIGSLKLSASVALAPLSGITDVPFRALVRSFGAELVYSEMVASGELLRGLTETRLRASPDGSGLHAVQLAGRDAGSMSEAARRVASDGADLIDINMGCPAKKVVGGLSGAALMRDLDHALRLIEATVEGAGAVPVTLKMRLGWDRASINAPELARRAEAAGIRLVTVHGRTRDQFYDGHADWPAIAAVKAAVSIPVVANGDLRDRAGEIRMRRESRADGVMIGRGACGRPWLPAMLAGTMPAARWRESFGDLVSGHYEAMLRHYGHDVGMRHARKHLGWYVDAFSAASGVDLTLDKAAMLRAVDPAAVVAQIRALFAEASLADVDRAPASFQKAA
ncbi:tRNA-dihydrouridine synthase [Aureimonas sp. AU12]|uniref:tRNA dihydrouridine synthase n=1 Tax=Aureimonas sp. AU12 TaxID=1638161 RepID=UPI001FCD7E84|nr:tRNA-dihydrouridine synthase [Aureimonas sp. AU12]